MGAAPWSRCRCRQSVATDDGREPIAVEPGSDLAGDDARFMGFNDSNLVGHSLATATEHLDFILSVMKQTSTRYPTPRS